MDSHITYHKTSDMARMLTVEVPRILLDLSCRRKGQREHEETSP